MSTKEEMSDQELEQKVSVLVNTGADRVRSMTKLTSDLADVRKAMGIAVEMFELEWPKFLEHSKKALEDTRLWRMAQSRELRDSAAVLEEIGRILKRSDMVSDSMKLKEFVETLERLKALHESGFLEKAMKGLSHERSEQQGQ